MSEYIIIGSNKKFKTNPKKLDQKKLTVIIDFVLK